MAGSTRSGLRIILLILLIVVLFLGGLLWFDFLGIVDVRYRFAPVLKLVGLDTLEKLDDPDDILLLDRERLDKQIQALDIRAEELDKREDDIILKEAEAFYTLYKKRKLYDEFFEKFNFENYGGTPILGVNKNIVIGHGISNDKAIKNMILHTKEVVEVNLSEKIKEAFK